MTVIRKVVSRDVGERTATEHLECGHDNVLYRDIRGGKVAWRSQRGHATGLAVRTRECGTCAAEAVEAAAARQRGWKA